MTVLDIRVLIVEDDFLVSEMIRGILEGMGYIVVGVAADGYQAVEMAQSTRPDVIIMDLGLPNMDGVEATRRIYESCPTPIVILTAYDAPDLVEQASAVGAGAYLVKPPGAREMERAITISMARFNDMMELRRLNIELQAEIAERIQTQASLLQVTRALQESEEKYRHVVDHANEAIVVAQDRMLRFSNPKAVEITGYSQTELASTPFTELVHPDDREMVVNRHLQRLRGELVPNIYSFKIVNKSGDARCVQVNAVLIDWEGKPATLTFLSDITERMRAEVDLRKSEEFNRALIEHSPIGISVRSRTGRLLFYNDAWKKIWAISDENIAQDLMRVRPKLALDQRDDYLGLYRDQLEQIYQNGGSLHAPKLRMMRPCPGKAEWIDQYFYAIQDESGQVDRVVVLTEDATQRERAEEQIKASLREKDVLLREIHHRVKNNLQIIHSLLDLQSDYIQDEQALEVFRESQQRVRAMALVHERLYQSKDLAKVDLAEYIQNLSNDLFLSYGTDAANITLETNVSEIVLDIDMAIPCGLIISELVSNAMKHAFPNGRKGKISIDFHPVGDDDGLTLVIQDDGVGFRQDWNPENLKSFGLRLVSMLIRQLKGEMEIDQSNGTLFEITLRGS
ncbi:MAG: PAS domain S-box protein [Chloroflexi bacterium]|nr:PAS domain S-box protein [Chloroflexota bacterium]